MNTFIKFFILFVVLTIASPILMTTFSLEFGTQSYWSSHGVGFLIFVTFFPRLTLLFSSVAFGGLFWWVAFFLCPRLLIAFLAKVAYWQTNPFLVIISWLVALGGESTEKHVVRTKIRSNHYVHSPKDDGRVIDI